MINLPLIDWNLFALEAIITSIFIILVIVDIFFASKDDSNDWVGILSFIGIIAVFVFWLTQGAVNGVTFNGMFAVDSLSWFFKGIFIGTMFFVLVMTQQFFRSLPKRSNEFYLLLWLALLGMCLVASSADFLMLFISIEILTISMYVMTAYLKSDRLSLEAGMKYLILGSLSAAFLLYGISLLYGTTHSTNFSVIQNFVHTQPINITAILAMILIFAGIGFKIAVFPFQMWAPDVYQGAPTPVTALLSVGSKAAGLIAFIRIFMGVFEGWHPQFNVVLAILAAITMCYGNLIAMFQTNIKRLFGYSSIAHAGYLMMGAAAGSVLGASGINYYILGYLFTNLAAFLVILLFFIVTKSDEINEYSGLYQRSGILGVGMILSLASLAGLPPLAGFFGKFTILLATVQAGFLWLTLIAVVNIVISTYYYLKVMKKIFVDSPNNTSQISVSLPMQLVLGLLITGILVVGIFQGPFLESSLAAINGMYLHP